MIVRYVVDKNKQLLATTLFVLALLRRISYLRLVEHLVVFIMYLRILQQYNIQSNEIFPTYAYYD